MTKKELIKMIIEMEYKEEQRSEWLVKARTADLMKQRKGYLIERVEHLSR